ncbi:hypothetical protein FKR81_37495 [Lentzea tibetensis]|uniref:Uncharacterized protein n=1 Tax=Lentzea tibetensis TaxID=2591470 RepID=A0A563EHI2_9PSEU|nr:hypothetical protein [Lentzea tibetensis]TWP46065.1 hypothetical protein FKR81_37495 [Lentzea tibetensis]
MARWIRDQGDVGLSVDAAADLLRLEGLLRAVAADVRRRLMPAETAIAAQRTRLAAASTRGRLPGRRERRAATAALDTAITRQAELAILLDETVTLQHVLRDFVIGLDPPSGVLRAAAEGWARSPEVPASVVVLGPEDNFLATDTRRGRGDRGISVVDGDVYGERWRRDGDDDSPWAEPTDRDGPWRLGFIPRTGEIYSSRRCGYLTQEVWLLGRDFEPQQAHELLTRIEPRMREPNSLILAAGVVHAARTPSGNRQCAAPRSSVATMTPRARDTG